MKLSVTGRHLTVSAATRNEIAKKLDRLERFLNDSAVSAQCVVAQERQAFVCEITVHARGDHMLHGVGKDTRLSMAITAAAERVTQQAKKLSDRWKTRRKTGRRREVAANATEAAVVLTPSSQAPRVIRSRGAAVKPMSLDDAVLALSSDQARPFIVFRQASNETIAVLFRRPDGHYGLIEPEA
jgi:putative sigma-54 modulation protein